jgi:hypothetical protein
MTDLNSLLNTATGGHRPATTTDIDADVARGRRALRNRRVSVLGRGAFALTLVAGVVVAQNGGAFDGSPAKDPVITAPSMAFVAYTGTQPAGFSVTTVPAGWRIQGVNEYSLVIVPPGNDKPATDVQLSSFQGKLLVSLESLDATEAPTGTPVSVGGQDGFVSRRGDGYGQLRFTDSSDHRMYVQWPVDAGWTDREVADFAAGIKVLSAAKATRG